MSELTFAGVPTTESPDTLQAVVGIGRRVVVLSNLGLSTEATTASQQSATSVANALDSWQGPGTVVLAGNLLDLRRCSPDETEEMHDLAGVARGALDAHRLLAQSLKSFAAASDRRLICLPGAMDSALAARSEARSVIEELGAEVAPAVDLLCETAAGERRVKVLPGADLLGARGPGPASSEREAPDVPWQDGMDRLADSSALPRLVRSRTVYRWLGRNAWLLAIPFVIVLVLSLPVTSFVIGHVFPTHPGPIKALHRVRNTRVGARLLAAAL